MKFDNQTLKTIIALILSLGLLAYAFFNFLYKPLQDKEAELDKQIIQKETELKETQRIVDNLDVKKAEYEKVKKELEYVIKRLPSKEEIPELLEIITRLAIKTNIELISFRPQSFTNKEVYEEIPVSLSVKGTYHNLGLFLTQIGNLERIITSSKIRMSAISATVKEPATTSAELLITAFVYIYKEH